MISESERIFNVTRNGVFGLSPGIELALVSFSQDARRFHHWEASPLAAQSAVISQRLSEECGCHLNSPPFFRRPAKQN